MNVRTTLALSIPILLATAVAEAAPLNGGFETGDYTDWTTIGDALIKNVGFGTGAISGDFNALFKTNTSSGGEGNPDLVANLILGDTPPVTAVELETFLDLGAGALDTLAANLQISSTAFQGSAIKQTFQGTAGQLLSFDYIFLTNETGAEEDIIPRFRLRDHKSAGDDRRRN